MLSTSLLLTVYAMSPQTVTNRLQRVMNAAARVVSDTWKFDRGLKAILHDELHWLDVPERIEYKLGVIVMVYHYRCLHGQHLATSLITLSQPLMLLLAATVYDLSTGTVSLCLTVDSARTAVVLSTMPARQSGTGCLMNLEIRTVLIVLNGS